MPTQHLAVPGHGTVFRADPGTELPDISEFTLTGAAPAGWKSFGHTSKANIVSFATEGGDTTPLDTWLFDNVRNVVSSARRVSLNINALEISRDTLDVAFNGRYDEANDRYIIPNNPQPLQQKLYVLCQDNTASLGFEIPLADITASGMFTLNPAEFVEVPLSAQLLVATGDDALEAADGTPGLMAVHFPPLADDGDDDDSGEG